MNLELICQSIADIKVAIKNNVSRIELCSNLECGGLTPSKTLLNKIKKDFKITNIPINVLIRPRAGNFEYTKKEFEQMLKDIIYCKRLGFSGIVIGFTKNNKINYGYLKEVSKMVSNDFNITFHRAIECVNDKYKAMSELIKYNISTILISPNVQNESCSTLNEYKKYVNEKLIIMPGGGINIDQIQFFKEHNFNWVHTSAKKTNVVNINKNKTNIDETLLNKMLKICRTN